MPYDAGSGEPEYLLIRSGRRTLSLEIRLDGQVVVRAPRHMPEGMIREFVRSREAWIRAHQRDLEMRKRMHGGAMPLSEAELRELAARAAEVIPERAAYYAPKIGVTYGRITIRHQRTRWGSCSVKGNLNFNCLLMLAPPEVLDSVVVHELCHRKEMNHSARFYAEVLRVFPKYREAYAWLRKNGPALLARLPQPRS